MGELTAGRAGTHAALAGTCGVPADISYVRVVETLAGELVAEHVFDASEAAGDEGCRLRGGRNGARRCD